MGVMSKHGDFWHVSNISIAFEWDWTRTFFLPAGEWSPISAFKRFEHYLPTTKDPQTGKEWVRDPFVNKPGESTLSMLEKDQLLEISNGGGLTSMSETTANLHIFWIKVKAEYSAIATQALKNLLTFPMSSQCEAQFSAVTATKMRLQSRLDVSNTLQCHCLPSPPDESI